MKAEFWVGVAALVLGIVLLVVPIPRNERKELHAGGLSVGIETGHKERVSPFVSAVIILGGAGIIFAGRSKS